MKFKLLSIILLLAVLLLIAGCGGGTVGTDDGAQLRLAGTVVDTSGRKISDALVTIEATGDSARSDEQGRFEIVTEKVAESRFRVDGMVAGKELSIASNIFTLKQGVDLVNIAIVVSVEEGMIVVEDLDVVRIDPTPTPANDANKIPDTLSVSTLTGVVRDQSGMSIAGVRITIDGDRISTTSARDGSFELTFRPRESRLGVLFEYQDRRSRISLTGLPSTPALVHLKIVLTSQGNNPDIPQSKSTELVDTFSFKVRPRQ